MPEKTDEAEEILRRENFKILGRREGRSCDDLSGQCGNDLSKTCFRKKGCEQAMAVWGQTPDGEAML